MFSSSGRCPDWSMSINFTQYKLPKDQPIKVMPVPSVLMAFNFLRQ